MQWMEEVLHHLRFPKYSYYWAIGSPTWCKISSIYTVVLYSRDERITEGSSLFLGSWTVGSQMLGSTCHVL